MCGLFVLPFLSELSDFQKHAKSCLAAKTSTGSNAGVEGQRASSAPAGPLTAVPSNVTMQDQQLQNSGSDDYGLAQDFASASSEIGTGMQSNYQKGYHYTYILTCYLKQILNLYLPERV